MAFFPFDHTEVCIDSLQHQVRHLQHAESNNTVSLNRPCPANFRSLVFTLPVFLPNDLLLP